MSLSLRFRQQLALLVQAHDEGCGPVEREAVQRLAAGLPMTALQIHSFAEECYPAEIRSFLDTQGYQALYERDLDRARAIGVADTLSPTIKVAVSAVKSRREAPRMRGLGRGLHVVVLAAALLAGGLFLTSVLPRLQQEPERPLKPPANVVAPPLVVSTPPGPCLQSMRDGATAWCENALTGSVMRDPGVAPELADCGDRLKVNGDTVRLALDRIFEEEATYTYRHAEVSERCAAAAKLAAL